ncbi:MAG: hypothetical protein IKS87_00875 [Lachnospiraceae bacterium]|nr:hypothetical protein [Lachnospiraceae bacterium]
MSGNGDRSYFKEALGDFIRNFAYGDEIRKLVRHGYDADRIIKEMAYPLSDETIAKMVERARQELEDEV